MHIVAYNANGALNRNIGKKLNRNIGKKAIKHLGIVNFAILKEYISCVNSVFLWQAFC